MYSRRNRRTPKNPPLSVAVVLLKALTQERSPSRTWCCVRCASHELMKYGDVKKAAKGTYTVDDASDRDANSFFIFKNDNPRTSSLYYHGFQFSNYYFSVSKRYTHYDRRFNYELKLKSNLSTAKAFLEYVVKDFNDLGIPLKSFDAKSKYVKVLLNYKEEAKYYTVELNDYGSGPTLRIDVSYKKP